MKNYVKEYLAKITKLMGLDVTFESKIREQQIIIKTTAKTTDATTHILYKSTTFASG